MAGRGKGKPGMPVFTDFIALGAKGSEFLFMQSFFVGFQSNKEFSVHEFLKSQYVQFALQHDFFMVTISNKCNNFMEKKFS